MHNDIRLIRGCRNSIASFLIAAAISFLIMLGALYHRVFAQTAPRIGIDMGQFTNLGVKGYYEYNPTNSRIIECQALTDKYLELRCPTQPNTSYVYHLQFRNSVNGESPRLRTTNGGIVQDFPNPKYIPWTDSPMILFGNGQTQSFFMPTYPTQRIWRVLVTTN